MCDITWWLPFFFFQIGSYEGLPGRFDYESIINMHRILGLDVLIAMRLFHVSLSMFKVQKHNSPVLSCLFEEMEIIHDRQTKSVNRGDLVVVAT